MDRSSSFFGRVRRALGAVFGDLHYSPPSWLKKGAGNLTGSVKSHPKTLCGVLVGCGILAISGWYGYQWWDAHRARPVERTVVRTIDVAVTNPSVAAVDSQSGKATLSPLVMTFSESAAPIEMVEKVVDHGVGMKPEVAGSWKWESDKQLVFRPVEEWPAGVAIEVFANASVFAEEVKLDAYEWEVETPAFALTISDESFYTDPTDPTRHQVVATVTSNYEITEEALDSALRFKIMGESDLFAYKGSKPNKIYQVEEDEKMVGYRFYLRSSRIAIPEESDVLKLTVVKSMRATSGGDPLQEEVTAKVRVPDRFSGFSIANARSEIVRDDEGSPEQFLFVDTSGYVAGDEMGTHVEAWRIPKNYRFLRNQRLPGTAAVTDEILAKWEPIHLQRVETEIAEGAPVSTVHAFKFRVEGEGQLFVRVSAGVEALGGFELKNAYGKYLPIPRFPKEVELLADGGVIALNGERKLGLKTRGVNHVRLTFARVPQSQINHLVALTEGDFQSPSFQSSWIFNEENIAIYDRRILPVASTNEYEASFPMVDVGAAMDRVLTAPGDEAKGLFFLKVEGVKPREGMHRRMAGDGTLQDWLPVSGRPSEERFVMVTDLGVLAKSGVDGRRDVFVQSLSAGEPLDGVEVGVIAKNGIYLAQALTGEEGYAQLPPVSHYMKEKRAVALVLRRGNDVAFLPFGRNDRQMNFSRFDTGGIYDWRGDQLEAFLFSERGIYRPGDDVYLGAVVKRRDWGGGVKGLPVEISVTDSKGSSVYVNRTTLTSDGFVEFTAKTNEALPTGNYTASLYRITNNSRKTLATHRFRVEDFMPDTMKIDVAIAGAEKGVAWIKPEDIEAKVNLQTLFGFPASDRKMKGKLELSAASFYFSSYPDHIFHNRLVDESKDLAGDTVPLGEQKTDENGDVTFDLKLERFANACFKMNVLAEGFEASGGRSVRGAASVLVSPFDYVIGYKPDGELSYIGADTERSVELLAVDRHLKSLALDSFVWRIVESRHVSVLTKNNNGTYSYVSTLRDRQVSDGVVDIAEAGSVFPLPTSSPGDFRLELLDANSQVVMECPFTIAGKGESGRSLERDAELDVKLALKEWSSGELIEMSVRAPYTGAGLITLETDRVIAYRWFKTDSTSSVQTIRLPEGVEGTVYVSVGFVRALDSPEVFMSPLSYAVHPITANPDKRKLSVELRAPKVVKPGDELSISYRSERPGRVVIYAVDAGIHQITDYTVPQPLKELMKKKGLRVETAQLLDLILPEFSILRKSKAFGGGGAPPKLHINPFKRRREPPVVFWSGIVESGTDWREVTYSVPDYFSGKLNLMAVAVEAGAVGQISDGSLARGPMVLTPSVPLFASPGDEFVATVAVANNLESDAETDRIAVSVVAGDRLQLVDGQDQVIELAQGEEKTARFRFRVEDVLGGVEMKFTAKSGDQEMGRGATLSVRPASPFVTEIQSGYYRRSTHDLDVRRVMYPEFRKLSVSVSSSPMGLAAGLEKYLRQYPWGCTEQTTSRAMGRLLLRDEVDFGFDKEKAARDIDRAMSVLGSRQQTSGAFGYWSSSDSAQPADDFLSVYVMSFLVEAKLAGYPVPARMYDLARTRMRTIASATPETLDHALNQAAAIYLLTRGDNQVTTNLLLNLRDDLSTKFGDDWKRDLSGMYVAATYKLLKKDKEGEALMGVYLDAVRKGQLREMPTSYYNYYHDRSSRAALGFALICRHFPETARDFGYDDLSPILQPIHEGRVNTISAASGVLALKAYSQLAGDSGVMTSITAKSGSGGESVLAEMARGYRQMPFSEEVSRFTFGLDQAGTDLGAFYQVVEAGFDRGLPKDELRDGLEVFRELIDDEGKLATSATVGDPLTVRITVRNISGRALSNLAVLDLLPGGFEVEANGLRPGMTTVPGADFVEVREDRNVFFLGLGKSDLRTFEYRIKPTAVGEFTIPPVYAENMYDPGTKARSGGSKLSVLASE